MARKVDRCTGTPCPCGHGDHLVTCHDCHKYPVQCADCFLDYHCYNPFHWALVWNNERNFFSRKDISSLQGRSYAINSAECEGTCHGLECLPACACKSASTNTATSHHDIPHGTSKSDCAVYLTVVDTNGIHSMRMQFCYCQGEPDRVKQLMAMGLFPATLDLPATAFTFKVLKQFQLMRMQGKIAGHDFVISLSQLTDGAFPSECTVSAIVNLMLVLANAVVLRTSVLNSGWSLECGRSWLWRGAQDSCMRWGNIFLIVIPIL